MRPRSLFRVCNFVFITLIWSFKTHDLLNLKTSLNDIMSLVVLTVLSLGVLNVLLDILVFVLPDLVYKLATFFMNNLFLLRLQKNGRAPIRVEHGSLTTRIKQKPVRLRHFRSSTKLAIIFLSTVLFILFEIAAESGVGVSDRCRPGDSPGIKNIESVLATQSTKWDCDSLIKTLQREGFVRTLLEMKRSSQKRRIPTRS